MDGLFLMLDGEGVARFSILRLGQDPVFFHHFLYALHFWNSEDVDLGCPDYLH
jgi:hypothetical protein